MGMSAASKLAPIVVFTYNRPEHTRRVLCSLSQNTQFEQSPVTVYCDGPKRVEHAEAVEANRRVVRQCAPAHARIVAREVNLGLANSIIGGVSEHLAEHGRVIVVEDDLVLSSGALRYLNEGLTRYAGEEKVMHIAAYMFPVLRSLPEAFFYREATCWGWATWDRAWKHFEPDASKLLGQIDRRALKSEFDVEDSMYFYPMLRKQAAGELDSWAIRWYASMFLNGGLSLHPGKSYVENLGFDGSGVHCNIDQRFIVTTTEEPIRTWPTEIVESRAAIDAMKEYRRQSSPMRSLARGPGRSFWSNPLLETVTNIVRRTVSKRTGVT